MKNNLPPTNESVLHIKNMVCPRCIMAVRQCLENLGLHPLSVELGTVLLEEPLTDELHHRIEKALAPLGQLHRDYSFLSKLFSETTGTTIEKYFIAQKIERAKELIVYGELSLNEIADKLGYSSVAYLSSQFKSVTGLTPSYFKKLKENRRKALDEIL